MKQARLDQLLEVWIGLWLDEPSTTTSSRICIACTAGSAIGLIEQTAARRTRPDFIRWMCGHDEVR